MGHGEDGGELSFELGGIGVCLRGPTIREGWLAGETGGQRNFRRWIKFITNDLTDVGSNAKVLSGLGAAGKRGRAGVIWTSFLGNGGREFFDMGE